MFRPVAKELRNRATVLVMRDGKVLLVRGSSGQFREFAMPGGGIEEEEFPIVAAASELHEETGLRANRIEYMLTSKSSIHNHVVFSLEADGDVVPGPEIGEYLWWDRKVEVPTFSHVNGILGQLQ